MKTAAKLRTLTLAVLCFAAMGLLLLSGCATHDPENLAERPWNSPKGWEHGLPPGINEGR